MNEIIIFILMLGIVSFLFFFFWKMGMNGMQIIVCTLIFGGILFLMVFKEVGWTAIGLGVILQMFYMMIYKKVT